MAQWVGAPPPVLCHAVRHMIEPWPLPGAFSSIVYLALYCIALSRSLILSKSSAQAVGNPSVSHSKKKL